MKKIISMVVLLSMHTHIQTNETDANTAEQIPASPVIVESQDQSALARMTDPIIPAVEQTAENIAVDSAVSTPDVQTAPQAELAAETVPTQEIGTPATQQTELLPESVLEAATQAQAILEQMQEPSVQTIESSPEAVPVVLEQTEQTPELGGLDVQQSTVVEDSAEPVIPIAEQAITNVPVSEPEQTSISIIVPAVEIQPVPAQPVLIEEPEVYQLPEQIADLEPKLLWHYFTRISAIPRGSYNEAGIAQFIMDEAERCGCTVRKDTVGNVIVAKPASSPLHAHAPIVVIQSHLDMVCEKHKTVTHDFTKDPIRFVRKDNHLYADGTTLGADNGIGVAAALALMKSKNLVHGPLEFLFTVVEEAGFDGAKNVTADTIAGRILLNVDTEEEGSLYIGCAGSTCVIASTEVFREPVPENYACYSVTIDGLRGGHSGVDINQGRGNALKIAGTLLRKFITKGLNFRLISIDGGNKRNAIARDVEIVLAIPKVKMAEFNKKSDLIARGLIIDLRKSEPSMTIEIKQRRPSKEMVRLQDQERILNLIECIPHGVISMSKFIKDLVETSTNFARVATQENCVVFETMQRSLIGAETAAIAHNVEKICTQHGFNPIITDGSPEWQPNENSQALRMAQSTYEKLFGIKMDVKAIHAGLECGAFVRQVPGLDAISFGPTIFDAHSPTEHVDVNTVPKFWKFLTGLLEDIAK